MPDEPLSEERIRALLQRRRAELGDLISRLAITGNEEQSTDIPYNPQDTVKLARYLAEGGEQNA